MSSTQHQLIEQCTTRLRGIVEALDNIHDTSPHRWSTDLDDVHSSAESLLALIKDQAPTQAAQGLAGAALAQPSPKCATCGGTGMVDDGEITCSEDGIPYENGPVKCVKDCPACKAQPSPAQAEQVEGAHVPDEVFAGVFAEWWEEEGQYCRAGGGDYERTFAFQAWRHLYPLLLQARAALAQSSQSQYEASFEEWLANELEGEDGQPVPAAVCDIALARRAFNHWPKLEHPAKVGGVRFSAGVSSRLVVEAAQRLNEFESTPEQEAERPEMSPERAAYFMRRFKSEEKLLGPNEQAAVDYVLSLLAQHESIVGALRAELESERNRVNIYVNNNGIRQDNERLRAELRAALARVAEQQTEIEWLKNPKALAETVHADAQEAVKLQRLLMDSHTACRPAGEGLMGWAHAALSAQAQHSVPRAWLDVQAERRRSTTTSTARRDLVKACALALAEIERLDRATATQGGPRDA
ncbi:TPA: hypothetical protein NIH98_001843 [Pseudomonas aeruginosa]|nr:hypothetical protein [Pseudomonas aeruginosa]